MNALSASVPTSRSVFDTAQLSLHMLFFLFFSSCLFFPSCLSVRLASVYSISLSKCCDCAVTHRLVSSLPFLPLSLAHLLSSRSRTPPISLPVSLSFLQFLELRMNELPNSSRQYAYADRLIRSQDRDERRAGIAVLERIAPTTELECFLKNR
jgi:hypothetical protein